MNIFMSIKRYIERMFHNDEDPIDAAKKMISIIQKFVGIHNVFGDKNRKFSVATVLATVVFTGSFVYMGSLSQFIYLIQVVPDKIETFKALNCLSATCVPLSKNIFMWTSRARLKTVIDMSRQGLSAIPRDSKAHVKMMDTLKMARYISWIVVVCNGFTHVIYIILPLLFTIFGNERYLPTTPGGVYGLSPEYETPFYEITFVLTVTATFFSAVNQSGYIVLFVTLLANDLGHIYAITETLNRLYEVLSDQDNISKVNTLNIVKENIKFCVVHHQFHIRYHSKLRDLYRNVFGVHFLMMIIVLVTTLQTFNAWDIRNTILTGITGITPLIIYCFGGEMLITAGTEMSEAIYSCGWHLMKVTQGKILLLMLCLSQQPLHFTASDVFVMNRETFGDVIQFIYKIYAVFN